MTVRSLVSERPIVTRLVVGFTAAMTVVLLGAAAFVYWRVEYALNRQLDQDLAAYQAVVQHAVRAGRPAPHDNLGETYQVFGVRGRLVGGDTEESRLIGPATLSAAARGLVQHRDTGSLLPPSPQPFRVVARRVTTGRGDTVVVASAISRRKHDEALRELMLQLAIADLLALAAAAFVGYRVARAALDPVERYREAAERAGADSGGRLPVRAGREDELTRLGVTFNDLLDRIEAANTRERQFLADASHELRGPLSLMRTELEWALHRPRNRDETRTTLVSLRGQVERLVELANALLDLEELRSEGVLLRDQVELAELVEAVVCRFSAHFADAGREVTVDVPRTTVEVNPRWVELALDNLVANALRYGAGTVQVEGRLVGDRLVLSVADQGPGFPEAYVTKAFDRFSRAEESRSTGGSGLGLSLVQAVAEAHGGSAGVEPGPGATVWLSLPAALPRP